MPNWSRLRCASVLVVGAACANERTAPPLPPLRVAPADTTIDLDGGVAFQVFRDDGSAIPRTSITVASSNPSVNRPCPDTREPLAICGNASGTTTLTFKSADGRTGTATLNVLRPRFSVGVSFGHLVAGHRAVLYGRYTDHTHPPVAYGVIDSAVAVVRDRWESTLDLTLKRAGPLDLDVFVAGDPTKREMVRLTVADPVLTAADAKSPLFAAGRVDVAIRVALRDQLGVLLQSVSPNVDVVEGASVARVVAVAPAPDTTASLVFTLRPVSAGTATVRFTMGTSSVSLPVMIRGAFADSAVVTQNGGVIDVAANDLPLSGAPVIAIQGRHGTASVVSGSVRYVPQPGYLGRDSVVYAATSGQRTDSAVLRLAVMPGPFTANVVAVGDYQAVDINNRGDVAGTLTMSDGTQRAFRWIGGRLDTLTAGSSPTAASGIDDLGNVVGLVGYMPLRWRATTLVPDSLLDHVPGGFPLAPRVSRSGVIAISDYPRVVVVRGLRRDTTTTTGFVAIDGVNDRGDVLYSYTNPMVASTWIQFADGRQVYVGGGYHTTGTGRWIRNDGSALMYRGTSFGFGPAAVRLFDGTSARDLAPVFGSWIADAYRLNGNGWILGRATLDSQTTVPALFIRDVGAQLVTLFPAGTMVVSAPAMNEAGQIVASVIDQAGVKRLVVYTPTQP